METERLKQIFNKTNGRCHICHNNLSFSGYGNTWEVEHSIPRAKGGTDHLNNLFAAHLSCNRTKGTKHTRTARAEYGNTRAPHSKNKIGELQTQHSVIGAVFGGVIGLILTPVLGPEMIFVGIAAGGAIGAGTAPSK
jgi:hypothetical protein